ncbi:MAG TPA: hypothetical protein DD490_13680, partial [Acidobacteria bacterium]|nr:hypothetical protein [Acidobacteriota bacterium]
MSKKKHRRARGSLALTYGRLGEDLSQGELSRRTGIPDVSALETKREPDRRLLERAFVAMDRVPEQVDVALFCADLLRRPEPFPPPPPHPR